MSNKEKMIQEIKLRRLIRKAIQIKEVKIEKLKKQQLVEEKKLRRLVRTLILEGDVDSDTKPAPYESTPMNMLADAFNQILPVFRKGLRKLTKPEERASFRMHTIQKLKNIFDNFDALDLKSVGGELAGSVGETDLTEQEEDPKDEIEIKIDDPARIVPDFEKKRFEKKPVKKTKEQEEEEGFEKFAMAGQNPTGARVAFDSLINSNVETVLANKRKTLYDDDDKDQYKEFALYNADLWLTTYEKEIARELGQKPGWEKPIVQRPEGAKEVGKGTEITQGERDEEDTAAADKALSGALGGDFAKSLGLGGVAENKKRIIKK